MHPAQAKDTWVLGGLEGQREDGGLGRGEKQEAGQAPWSEEIRSHSHFPTCREE